jgi:hypothetical protein
LQKGSLPGSCRGTLCMPPRFLSDEKGRGSSAVVSWRISPDGGRQPSVLSESVHRRAEREAPQLKHQTFAESLLVVSTAPT